VDAQCATNDWGLGLAREPKTVYYEDTTTTWQRAHSHCRYIIDFLFNVYIYLHAHWLLFIMLAGHPCKNSASIT
jgi:hypothetical protein